MSVADDVLVVKLADVCLVGDPLVAVQHLVPCVHTDRQDVVGFAWT